MIENESMKSVIVIGGGIIGLCSAYYLNEAGYDVCVIDKDDFAKGASHINAGYICPSHLIPLTAPGVVVQGIKWMFNNKSPLYIKPQINSNFLQWALAFIRKANQKHVNQSIPLIKQMALSSQALYEEIRQKHSPEVAVEKNGILMLCRTEKALEHEVQLAELAKAEGLDVSILGRQALKALEPDIELDVIGGTHFHSDWHMTPHRFMQWLKDHLRSQGVEFVTAEATNITVSNYRIQQVTTREGAYDANTYVLAAGAWTRHFATAIGESLILVPGKGYSINVSRPTGIRMPAILIEKKVAITPMNGFTRFAGTMEIGGLDYNIAKQRVDAIAASTRAYYPNLDFNKEELDQASCGLRPVTHDGLPYIARAQNVSNAIICTGHGMMGWTFGPISGVLVQHLVKGSPTPFDISGLRLGRH